MSRFSLDFETTSKCDIRLGAYRYANDPSTRILMYAVAVDDEDPLLWDFQDSFSDESLAAESLLRKAVKSGECISAFNAQFEVAVSHYRMKADLGIDPPPLDVWRCTQAMCKRAAAPESLAKAAAFFGLVDQKDAIGKALIGVFSDQTKSVALLPPPGMKDPATIKPLKNGNFTVGRKPANRKSASPILDKEILWDWQVKVGGVLMTVREAWDAFCGYCRQDVRTERELEKTLHRFDLKGDILDSFQFDLRMNFKGVPVNLSALENADRIVESIRAKLSARFEKGTGVKPSQRQKCLEWFQKQGYPEQDMQAGTVAATLASPPPGMSPHAVQTLYDYSLLQFAALAKISKMREAACDDGYVRGTTQWHAARTGRASGRIVQPQNYKRPTISDSDLCYRMICEGWAPEWFEEFWPSPLEAIASSIRHFIQPHEGKFISCDYTGVENRLAAWAVGDTEELALMVAGADMYKHMAVDLFGVKYEDVTKEQRTVAKPVVLACGYQVGGKTLQTALATIYGTEKTREECDEYVKIYRAGHPKTVQAWKAMQEAAVNAVRNPGSTYEVLDGKVEFVCGRVAGINYLTMRLPSGRRMFYPWPEVKRKLMQRGEDGGDYQMLDPEVLTDRLQMDEDRGFWVDHVSFYGKQPVTGNWGRIGTYGGRLFENLCQAMGADLLNYGCLQAEKAGVDIRMIIHDEILALDDGWPVEEVQARFCAKQPWAADFPLESSGQIVPYYTKD